MNDRTGRLQKAFAASLATHGIVGQPLRRAHPLEYTTWCGIWKRCSQVNSTGYSHYGAKGIRVSDEWKTFAAFFRDMGSRPSPKHQIDRIDNAKGYEPGNCRWATPKEQERNRTNNVWLEFNGERVVLPSLAERFGIKSGVLLTRLKTLGWPLEKALTTPVRQKAKNGKGARGLGRVA